MTATTSMHLPDDDSDVHFRPVRPASVSQPASKGPVIVGFFGLLIGLVVVVLFALLNGTRPGGLSEPPIIRANEEPIRIKPLDPGGVEIGTSQAIIDAVQPAPSEEPVIAETATPAEGAGIVIDFASEELPVAGEAELPPSELAGVASSAEVVMPEIAAPPIAPRKAEPSAPVVTGQVTQPRAPVLNSGPYLVQVASLTDGGAARRHWDALQNRYPGILSGYTPDIEVIDVSGKGQRHRLRVAGFQTRDEGMALCDRLKAAGGDCFVVRR